MEFDVPINKEMLNILCCPVSKVPIKMLAQDKVDILNKLISDGKVKDVEGNRIADQVREALVTEDGKTIYRIDDDIPVMLAGSGINTESLNGF